jgi:micrococcal nuclease
MDGDTTEVELGGQLKRVRHIDINAPEVGLPYADQSPWANRRLVEGQEVLLEKDRSEADRYGRRLRYVHPANGIWVNAELVPEGLAEATTYPPDTKYQTVLDGLEAQARDHDLGMWITSQLPSGLGAPPAARVVITPNSTLPARTTTAWRRSMSA